MCRFTRWPPCSAAGLQKMSGTLIGAAPGTEPTVLAGLAGDALADDGVRDAAERNQLGALLRTPGAVVLVGERAAQTPGLLTAVGELADVTGAGLAWVPRRAGERGALDAGALGDAASRRPSGGRSRGARRGRAGLGRVPARDARTRHCGHPGRGGHRRTLAEPDTDSAAEDGSGDGALGEPRTRPRRPADRRCARSPTCPTRRPRLPRWPAPVSWSAWKSGSAPFTELADVVFPVAAAVEKSGAYVNWEGRIQAVRGGAAAGGHAGRGPDPGHPRCRDGRRPVHPDAGGGVGRDRPAGYLVRRSRTLSPVARWACRSGRDS